MIRRVVGVALALVGLIVAAVGGVVAFWLIGPDDTVHSGEQSLSSKGLAIASTPELLNRNGPVLHVDVRSTKNQPVFLGVARDFDVASYLTGIAHTKLVQIRFPIALSTEDSKGAAGPLTAPNTLDWWITKANGPGTQSIAWPIEDGPYEIVIMNADGNTAPEVRVDFGIEIPQAFRTAVIIFAVGLVLLVVGLLLILVRRRPTPQTPVHALPQSPTRQGAPSEPARRVIALVGAFTLLTACAAIPQADTVTTLTRPAITSEAAAGLIEHHNQVSAQANETSDDKLLASVEGGTLLRETQAWYKAVRAVKGKPGGTWPLAAPEIGVPQFGSYPMRFLSVSRFTGHSESRHLGLWERHAAGSPWLMTFAGNVKSTVKLPDVTDLRPATAADDDRLAAAPRGAVDGLAKYLTEGPKSPRAAAFQPSEDITKLFADIAADKARLKKDGPAVRGITNAFTSPAAAPAFMTKSGSALVFASITHDYTMLIGANWQYSWTGFPQVGFSPATAHYESALTSTTIHDAVLLIPPKGHGKIQVLSLASALVDAGGY